LARRSSDPWAPPRAVLDADVIFSRVLHELFGRLASELQLLTLIWSDQLLDEAAAALVARKPTTPEVAARWVGYLRDVFPDGRVQLGLLSGSEFAKMTTDVGDQHVCELAVVGGAQLLVTSDGSYLREELIAHGVSVVTPDEFLVTALSEHSAAVLATVEAQAAVWGGGRSVDSLLAAYGRAGAGAFAAMARNALTG
jgi:predicted nucleic acid-binding protein